jgi:hypothetical protein
MYAAAAAVAFSFFALTSLWTKPRLRGAEAGAGLGLLDGVAGAAAIRLALRIVGILALAAFLTTAWVGPDDAGRAIPAPTWLYVWFWVGLVPASLLLGPVWRLLNPLRSIAALLRAVLPVKAVSVPARLGCWPAALSLFCFVWVELVDDMASSPRTVAVFVTTYCLIHVVAGTVFGADWFSRGDGFEVYSTMVARAAPIGRRSDRRLVVRNPLNGLSGTPISPDLTPVVVVILGSTAFDGLSRTSWWSGLVANTDRTAYLAIGTVGLIAGIAVIGGTFAAAMAATRRYLKPDDNPRPSFAPTLIPIAIGYTVAHYLSFALFQGQEGYLLANDPLVRGWNLFGLKDASVNYLLLTSTQISIIQISAIVVGHVVAVVAAHDRAVRLLKHHDGVRGQYPLMAVMVAYTAGGIALLAGS